MMKQTIDIGIADDLDCVESVGGLCYLPNSCASYPDMWSSTAALKIQFTGSPNYALVPISSFAMDNTTSG